MRFYKPFTLDQRQHAYGIYRSYVVTFNQMRFIFPPLNKKQRDLVKKFRSVIGEFHRTLANKDAKLRVDLLNDAMERADDLALQYSIMRLPGGKGFGNG